MSKAGLQFAGFADDERSHPERWKRLRATLDALLFRWKSGCIEENIIGSVADDKLEALINDPTGEKTGRRLRTIADRLGIAEKDFAAIKMKAGTGLRSLILDAALGKVPEGKTTDKDEKKKYKSHSQDWFKSNDGGRELARKMFDLGLWPKCRTELMPFCNAVRKAVELPDIADIKP